MSWPDKLALAKLLDRSSLDDETAINPAPASDSAATRATDKSRDLQAPPGTRQAVTVAGSI
jgi:hypothetical protein